MPTHLRDVTGDRGEKIVALRLTDYGAFERPLFRPGFLGDKWPAIDFYVELTDVPGKRLFFFAQVKTTRAILDRNATGLRISLARQDVSRLLEIPGPTYLLGVHEPSSRVFIRSVHTGVPVKAMTRIPLEYELIRANLERLHDEVRKYWRTTGHKPVTSVFA